MNRYLLVCCAALLIFDLAAAREMPGSEGYGAFASADVQTELVACEKAIYESNWHFETSVYQHGNMSDSDAELAYEKSWEANLREIFFHVVAQSIDLDAYSAKEKKVSDMMQDMYMKDSEAARREYDRLGEFCLHTEYDRVKALDNGFEKIDRYIRRPIAPQEMMEKAKIDFIEHATGRAGK